MSRSGPDWPSTADRPRGRNFFVVPLLFLFGQSNFGSFKSFKFQVKVKIHFIIKYRLAKREEPAIFVVPLVFFIYLYNPTLDYSQVLFHVKVKNFWPYAWVKCLPRFKLKGKGWNEEEKKRLQKWPLWRVRV